jgi:hypothetical protein
VHILEQHLVYTYMYSCVNDLYGPTQVRKLSQNNKWLFMVTCAISCTIYFIFPMAARLMGCGFGSRRGNGCLSLAGVVCCLVEVYASGTSHDRRNPTKCGVSQYYREISIMSRPWPTGGCSAMEKKTPIPCYFNNGKPAFSSIPRSRHPPKNNCRDMPIDIK